MALRVGWTEGVCLALLSLGSAVGVLVVARWFAEPLGLPICDTSSFVASAGPWVLVVSVPFALAAAGLLARHWYRRLKVRRTVWAAAAIGFTLTLVGWGYGTGALPQDVLPDIMEGQVVTTEAVEGRLLVLQDTQLLVEREFTLEAETSETSRLGPLAVGRYTLEVQTSDGRTATEQVSVGPFSDAVLVLLGPMDARIEQSHGDCFGRR